MTRGAAWFIASAWFQNRFGQGMIAHMALPKLFTQRFPKKLVQWARNEHWTSLFPIQSRAFSNLSLDRRQPLSDLIISAPTASGKTEAVFLPLFARMSNQPSRIGFDVLYVSPLRALINDQVDRLQSMAAAAETAAMRWHGEISSAERTKARRQPTGVILTTPESLEGIINRGSGRARSDLDNVLGIDAVVIDEFHAFFHGPRGRHLLSLLDRLEKAANRPIARLALSATLGTSNDAAKRFLRPRSDRNVTLIEDHGKRTVVSVTVKGFREPVRNAKAKTIGNPNDEITPVREQIGEEILRDFATDDKFLVFANSRAEVERSHEILLRLSKQPGDRRNVRKKRRLQLFVHYSSIAPEKKEAAEKAMKDKSTVDATAIVCTNTLELGIDIGKMNKVAQIEPPFTVASLRQRLGRSGAIGWFPRRSVSTSRSASSKTAAILSTGSGFRATNAWR